MRKRTKKISSTKYAALDIKYDTLYTRFAIIFSSLQNTAIQPMRSDASMTIALTTDSIKYGYLFRLIENSIRHPTSRIVIVISAYNRIIILT